MTLTCSSLKPEKLRRGNTCWLSLALPNADEVPNMNIFHILGDFPLSCRVLTKEVPDVWFDNGGALDAEDVVLYDSYLVAGKIKPYLLKSLISSLKSTLTSGGFKKVLDLLPPIEDRITVNILSLLDSDLFF